MPTIQERPKDLPRKPLVEAIVEVQWGLEGQPDPAYPIAVGRLYERVQPEIHVWSAGDDIPEMPAGFDALT
jgi:hypothetical protein